MKLRAILPALALALAACPSSIRSNDQATRDQEIAADILWAFHRNPRLEEVQVQCLEGVVTLKGRVASPEDQAEAEGIAYGIRSVCEVKNLIAVRPK